MLYLSNNLMRSLGYGMATDYMPSLPPSGLRYHILGSTFVIKELLKKHYCRWDPDAKVWWSDNSNILTELLDDPECSDNEKTIKRVKSLTLKTVVK